ncbi:MAG: DUF6506 family protein [Candidatus Limivicinus sp.]|jgi:hypothetical protein
MKFAFIIMGTGFDPKSDVAVIHGGDARIIGVSSIEEACREAEVLMAEGVSCLELCGAFGPEGAEKVIEATENRLAVGYVTHLPAQDGIFEALFGA